MIYRKILCYLILKKIYQSLGGTKEYDRKVWEAFGDQVGWRKSGKWLKYEQLTFSMEHDLGHLPFYCGVGCGVGSMGVGRRWKDRVGEWNGYSSLAHRFVDCNI
ncbi:MAG: GUN4 domain-containing protein [Trichodesmium sp. MAG_R03]|nr:GUN4 domain-containing protein [Trichodesmium sp. MAG_R03]